MKRVVAVLLAMVLTMSLFASSAMAADDGVYTGTARAMKGDLTVEVTLEMERSRMYR